MTDIRDFVNRSPTTPSLGNISSYVVEFTEQSPIDDFISARTELLRLANSDAMRSSQRLGQVAFIGFVSAFENYCRGVLCGCLNLCPNSQGKASEKNINLGGAIWHGGTGSLNRSAFELKSFADCTELKKTFWDYVGFELSDDIFSSVLSDFEKLMQFRHAVVHSDGVLPGRNAVKLEILRSNRPLRVVFDYDRLQSSALALSSLIELINRELFYEFCRRWAIDWRRRADWQPAKSADTLKKISMLFDSKPYRNGLPNKRRWSNSALTAAIESRFELT